VVVVAAYDDALEELEALSPAATLASAKVAAAARGYRVIDVGEGGNCETSGAWRCDGTVAGGRSMTEVLISVRHRNILPHSG